MAKSKSGISLFGIIFWCFLGYNFLGFGDNDDKVDIVENDKPTISTEVSDDTKNDIKVKIKIMVSEAKKEFSEYKEKAKSEFEQMKNDMKKKKEEMAKQKEEMAKQKEEITEENVDEDKFSRDDIYESTEDKW